jgi:hypothetical protein
MEGALDKLVSTFGTKEVLFGYITEMNRFCGTNNVLSGFCFETMIFIFGVDHFVDGVVFILLTLLEFLGVAPD